LSSIQNDGVSARIAAIKVVAAVIGDGVRLEQAIASAHCSDNERPLVRALSFGALRYGHRLERMAVKLVNRGWEQQNPLMKAILLVGLYQLEYAHAPAHAAIHTTVESAKRLHLEKAAGMVNACLRRFQREQQALTEHADASVAGRYSHPQWLQKRLTQQWPTEATSIMLAANEHPPLTLRVNRLRISREALIERLAKDGHPAKALVDGPDALMLERPTDVRGLAVFQEGLCSVQDLAAQWAVECLDLKPHFSILDACAAPGGKTGHILERCQSTDRVLAVDSDAKRAERIQSNLDRLGLKADILVADVTTPGAIGDELFDRILVDAPCSGTGVIRRHPDIKWLRRETDLSALSERQLQMLGRLWAHLKPAGQLLYVTCSILQEENHQTIQRFLERQPDAKVLDRPMSVIPVQCQAKVDGPFVGVQILPGVSQTDGFYYALLQKQG
jgi:16S rRNA (cytosine967-C5)-methyltransferase